MNEQYIAKTFFGLEEVLAGEIKALGGIDLEIVNRAVVFTGDLEVLYKVNLISRTALRVIKPIMTFTAHNETVLYKRLRRYNWWEMFSPDQSFAIDATVNSPIFTHSKYLTFKVKDAIVDLFRYKYNGRRPSIELVNPDVRINVHCRNTDFTISIDSSGESLHKRGYRAAAGRAPINEALAAGMVLSSGWDQESTLYDPMCGSGTILIEAALLALDIPPRLKWNNFAFQKWPDYNVDLWRKVRNDATDQIKKSIKFEIFGTEKEINLIHHAKQCLEDLDISHAVNIEQNNFFLSDPPADNGMIITNPPYGQRLGNRDIEAFYKQIGDRLKEVYAGWSVWILSGNKDAIKRVGLKTT